MKADRISAGILLYRSRGGRIEVLLVHPGGPYYARKDRGFWSIPKGEPDPGEEPLAAARREFREETGFEPDGQPASLDPVRVRPGKTVVAWAVAGDAPAGHVYVSDTCSIEWPPRSGTRMDVPEVDRWEFFELAEAAVMISPGQAPLLKQLKAILSDSRAATH